jgi:SRSO17 transposase
LSTDEGNIPAAVAAAKAADQVVVFVGMDQYTEKEGTDRQARRAFFVPVIFFFFPFVILDRIVVF